MQAPLAAATTTEQQISTTRGPVGCALGSPTVCAACVSRQSGICAALTVPEMLALSRHAHRRAIPACADIVSEGEQIESFGNILSGVVKLTKLTEDGRQQIVGLQFAPDFIGRPFDHESRVTATAATPTKLCLFPRSALEELTKTAPDIGMRLYQQTRRELDDAQAWMLALGRKTAFEKVASLLHFIGTHSDLADLSEKDRSFDLPLTRSEAADFLGLTTETVSRQMTKLRSEGLIALEGKRRVIVASMDALNAASGG